MPLLNFHKRFADAVQQSKKRTSIRAHRKRPINPGDRLYLYTGLRTKHTRKLGESTCIEIHHVRIKRTNFTTKNLRYLFYLNSKRLTPKQVEALAIADGLDGAQDLFEWIEKNHGFPFYGSLIVW